jgi:glycine dehydrogenase subunit 1
MLTGLDVANASMYEGASATVEAALMCQRVKPRDRVIAANTVHPEYLATVRTYLANLGIELVVVPHGPSGRVDAKALAKAIGAGASAIVVQSPNALGVVERLDAIADAGRATESPVVAVVAEPFSFGMLAAPGALGCDVVAGEAQSFGNAVSFGGPYLGILAAKAAYLRQMPGRIVGETTDVEGRRGFVLTLSTREQHIRREKATSNICTNQGLCMTAATIHMALLGKEGLTETAQRCHSAASYALAKLTEVKGVARAYSAPFFNEFALTLPRPAGEVLEALEPKKILGGFDLSRWFPESERTVLVACTERTKRADVDAYAKALHEVL